MNRVQVVLVSGSLAIHLGIWGWVALLPKEKKTDAVAIALSETKKKTTENKPPPPAPPPPPVEKPAARAKVAAPAPKAEPAPPPPSEVAPQPAPAGDAKGAMDGFADLGMALGGSGSMAVPTGPRVDAKPKTEPSPPKVKVLAAAAADECQEDPVKPQLDKQVQPTYSPEARQANVEGVVKLEVTVDATGRVTEVKVLKGLGYGLDEAAVAAAKQWSFKPATRCGKAVSYVIKPGVRFQLGS